MSKIEKALNRAREGGLQVVPRADTTGSATGTSVVAYRTANPETISRMAMNEVRMLGAGDLEQRGIIRPQHGEDPVVQVFRELRTKIVQHSHGQNAIVLVASVSEGCGGSFVSRNLAAAFAFDAGKTALLIDCNLADPSVHELLPNAPSLDLQTISKTRHWTSKRSFTRSELRAIAWSQQESDTRLPRNFLLRER